MPKLGTGELPAKLVVLQPRKHSGLPLQLRPEAMLDGTTEGARRT